MKQYLLSTHCVEGTPDKPPAPDEMQGFMAKIFALENEMKSKGAWVFGGKLHDPQTATVVSALDIPEVNSML